MKTIIGFTIAALLPLVKAHGAVYGDYAFGSASGFIDSNPLTKSLSLSQWFFRGLKPSSAKGSIDLNPGGKVTLNVACSQDNADQGRMCGDTGALHLKSNGQGSGCALLISYKNFDSIQPNDMSVFSVSHDCTKQDSHRTFSVPSNLPAGEATCAFHWVPPPESSQDEQYMTGFKCNVKGSNKGVLATTNQKPLYWAANGVQLPGNRPQYDNLPDGAQKLIVSGGSAVSSSSNTNAGTSKTTNGKKTGSKTTGGKKSGSSAKGKKKNGKGKKTSDDGSCPALRKCSANQLKLRRLESQLEKALKSLKEASTCKA